MNAVSLVELLSSYGFNNRVTIPTHRLGGMLDVAATRQDLTAPNVMSRLLMLGCQTTVYCSGLPLLLTPRQLSRQSSIAFGVHWTSTTSSQQCCLLFVYRMICTDSTKTWWRHFMTPSWRPSSTGPSQRIQSPTAHSLIPTFQHIIAFSQFSMPQPGWWVISSRACYTFNSETSVSCGYEQSATW